MWMISCQNYSSMGENALVVEVCGTTGETRHPITDYCNPGALSVGISGLHEEIKDPRDVAKEAVRILKEWEAKGAKRVTIRNGFTGGSTCPFDAPEHGKGIKEILKWGKETFEEMEKCPVCGDIMPPKDQRFYNPERDPDTFFCSESCANKEEEFCQEQDRIFQEEEWEATINKLPRESIVTLLEGASIQYDDDESIETLRTALLENVKDETIDDDLLTEE